ncbi:181_t:CDS:2 [Funneliformis mosseae]|uniref:181_t:CDS:1 n=1 Tax=Funneliformis mosseae TaxID=27381 RepID=A0A9N8Z4H5_FUNMO|nr:181_t:CDS:2 [Funneliformis mosseae]
MIYLGKSVIKQEFITGDIIELVFNCLDEDDDELTYIRSFIMRCLEIIPLESEVRLILYKFLFSRKPFQFISVIVEEIFVTENQEREGIFLTLIKDPEQALGHSSRLKVINNCLDIKNDVAEICCELIQPFFNSFELKDLSPYFIHLIGTFTNHLVCQQLSALQQVIATAFLKEFAYKFWKNYTQEDLGTLVKEINTLDLDQLQKLSMNNPDMPIIEFINRWLKLANLTNLERLSNINNAFIEIFEEFSLKHIVVLYELIEEQVANSIIDKIEVAANSKIDKIEADHSIIDNAEIKTQKLRKPTTNLWKKKYGR